MNAAVALGFNIFVHQPDGTLRRVYVGAGPIAVGSDPACELHLDSPEVSPRHALLDLCGDWLELTDTSLLGTRVGDDLVCDAAVRVDPTDTLGVGPFLLRFQLVEQPPEAAPVETAPIAALPARGAGDVALAVRRRIHRDLLDHLDLIKLERSRMNDHLLRAKVTHALRDIVAAYAPELPVGTDTERLVEELTHEAIGLGPLEELLADRAVTEIMVVDPSTIYVERGGRIEQTSTRFTDEESVRSIIERIVAPLGRRIDESAPMLDARLRDGSRVNAVIRPLAIRGTCITIRKFSDTPLTAANLIDFGSLTPRIARFLERCVVARKNLVISGGTGSGKTTLLNVLSAAIPDRERIVTIEDAAELQLAQSHVVSLESRPPNMEGKGQITIRDLVKNAMRMRPDRIIVGECRGAEALDMLQAMNTGHDGSMTTTHANSPAEALKRIETLALMAGLDIPARALREQIALSIDILVQQARLPDGARRITSVSEVIGIADDGEIATREIFGYRRLGTTADGTVTGEFYASGYLPSFIGEFLTHGLVPGPEGIL